MGRELVVMQDLDLAKVGEDEITAIRFGVLQ
jgi:hypothetical protein